MRIFKLFALTLCSVLPLFGAINAFADDSEIFFGNAANAGSPNILFVIDTSGSMATEVASGRYTYNPSTTYNISGCTAGYVYYEPTLTATGKPSCSSSNKIPVANFTCTPATTAFATTAGQYSGNAIRWVTQTTTTKSKGNTTTTYAYYWTPNLNLKGTGIALGNDVTCQQDTDSQYPTNGTVTNPPSASPVNGFGGTSTNNYFTLSNSPTLTSYVFYSANYVAYLNDPSQSYTQNRLDVVKAAAMDLITSLSGVNAGLMTYSANGSGGRVVAAVQDISTGTGKKVLTDAISGLYPGGNTPLSETLYEAYLYYAGAKPKNGLNATACADINCKSTVSAPSEPASLNATGDSYKSPIQSSCQNNYIVYLTDGLPNGDNGTDSNIEGLNTLTNGCYTNSLTMWKALGYSSTPVINYYDGTTGLCTKEMSKYMFSNGFTSTSTSGTQHVTTYFIGFGNDVGSGAAQAYLNDAATAGGGIGISAGDAASLAAAFQQTVGAILNTSATFASPAVAVDAFNKTQLLEDLYFAEFKPSPTRHWPGNVKKFKLRNGQIVGKDFTNAVDSTTGFFSKQTQDFWQQSGDSNTDLVGKGGAANMIPVTTSRHVYTYLGSSKYLTDAGNAFDVSNVTALEGAGLGTTSVSTPTSTTLINWARGDADGDTTVTTDIRHQMGDPIHSQPAVVIYGNASTATTTTDKLNDAVVYSTNNDGFVHAIDVSTGTELWSFIPPELIGDQLDLFNNFTTTPVGHYALDGDIRVLTYDVNGNGVVDVADGDRVFLYFSQGRGGDTYYALDVTNKKSPKFEWSLGSAADSTGSTTYLSSVSKSWSAPTLGRVSIKGATQNPQDLVLIFAGGYDDSEEAQGYNASDAHGNALYIVDAVKGTVLWSQTRTNIGTGTGSAFDSMSHAIPGTVTVLDTDGDGFSDRLYVGDLAGQLWRFDIANGNSASELVAGGVIASLGEKGQSSPTVGDITNNRTFYSAPDVSYNNVVGGANYYNIAIGSGDRSMPKSNKTTQDYFFNVRDYQLLPMTQAAYDAVTAKPIKLSDLTTVTGTTAATSIGSAGWKLALGSGEKSLASSITVNGVELFTTYVPGATGNTNTCTATTGSGNVYAIYTATAYKYFDDVYQSFPTTGLPSQVNIIKNANIVRTTDDTTSSSSTSSGISSGGSNSTTCVINNVTVNCPNLNSTIKSSWQESGVK